MSSSVLSSQNVRCESDVKTEMQGSEAVLRDVGSRTWAMVCVARCHLEVSNHGGYVKGVAGLRVKNAEEGIVRSSRELMRDSKVAEMGEEGDGLAGHKSWW